MKTILIAAAVAAATWIGIIDPVISPVEDDQARIRSAPTESGGGALLSGTNVTGSYIGSFKAPNDSSGGYELDYWADIGGMTYDPVSGHIFLHEGFGLCEINIPALVSTSDPAFMNEAAFQQTCIDPTEGNPLTATVGDDPKIGTILPHGSNIYLAAYRYFNGCSGVPCPATVSHFKHNKNFSTASYAGVVQLTADNPGWLSKYGAPIPSGWQAALGGPAITGNAGIPIQTRQSYGFTAFVFDPADINVETPPIATTMVMGYPDTHQTFGAWNAQSSVWNGVTFIGGLALIDDTNTAVMVGVQGTGPFCYGNGDDGMPIDCPDAMIRAHGNHGPPYRYQVWLFDIRDWAAVKAGTKQSWEVEPYSYYELTTGLMTPPTEQKWIPGIAYDPSTQILYVAQSRTWGFDNAYAVIHAFQVDITP